MAAYQVPPSLGFSRQEHWSGLPFPSPMHESEKWKWSRSVMSDCSWPHGLKPTRLLCPWDFPGKSTGVGCHHLLPKSSLEGYICMAPLLLALPLAHLLIAMIATHIFLSLGLCFWCDVLQPVMFFPHISEWLTFSFSSNLYLKYILLNKAFSFLRVYFLPAWAFLTASLICFLS